MGVTACGARGGGRAADLQACAKIRLVFPGARLPDSFTLPAVLGFVDGALGRTWQYCLDTLDDPPPCPPVDAARFLAPFIPRPEDIPPRRFVKADPDGRYPDAPDYVWLDAHLREVPSPRED